MYGKYKVAYKEISPVNTDQVSRRGFMSLEVGDIKLSKIKSIKNFR